MRHITWNNHLLQEMLKTDWEEERASLIKENTKLGEQLKQQLKQLEEARDRLSQENKETYERGFASGVKHAASRLQQD